MNKFFTNSFKAFAIAALLSNVNGFAMEAAPVAPESVKVAEVIVVTEPVKVAEAAATAVESVAAVTTEAIEAVKAEAAKVELKKDCGCKFTASIKNGWNRAVTAVSNQKTQIFAAAKDMKARGWTNWTRNEKAGVVIGATAAAALVTYVAYKTYKALTAPKAKANTRNNRA